MFIEQILNVLDTVHNTIKASIPGKDRYLQFSANTEDSVVRKCAMNSRTVLFLLLIMECTNFASRLSSLTVIHSTIPHTK